MEPSLLEGDWLIVDRRPAQPVVGDVVVARDPRERGRLIVKRVGEVGTDLQLVLVSDHPAHAGDRIGPLAPADIVGRASLRYWPMSRVAVIGRGSTQAPDRRAARKTVPLRGQRQERAVDE